MKTDVAVVGGGPGGLYVAYLLARHGIATTVLEEHESFGEPVHCTGVLASKAFREFELPAETVLNELNTVQFYSPLGQNIRYSTDHAEAVVIDRNRFDRALSIAARSAGAQVLVGRTARRIDIQKNQVVVTCSSQFRLSARVCILACGGRYSLHRQLGLDLPPIFLQTAQVEVPARSRSEVEVHFGQAIAPKGFAWAVPVRRADGSYVRIGLMSETNATHYFRLFTQSLMERWSLDSAAIPRPRLKALPLAPISKTYLDRLLVIGDAAGLVKATTGGGIFYSLLSGKLAAEAIQNAFTSGNCSANALGGYEKRWRSLLDRELNAQLHLRRLFNQVVTDKHMESLFHLARVDGIIPLMRQTARFNEHRQFITALLAHPEVRQIMFNRRNAV